MASAGGVGGAGGSGGGGNGAAGANGANGGVGGNAGSSKGCDSKSVDGKDSTGSVGAKSDSTTGAPSADKTACANDSAKANNVDGAKAKNGIDCEPAQKADLNGKMDAASVEQETTAKTDVAKAETAKTEVAKTETAKTETAKTDVQAASLADKVKEKAKEVVAKAVEMAEKVKEVYDAAVEKVETQKELAKLARDPQVAAMLDTLGFTEGTGLNYGKVVNGKVIGQNVKSMPYDTTITPGKKNVTTLDLTQHPNLSVRVRPGLVSSAAGRYQFLSRTWQETAQRLGLTNFNATSQDLAAVQKMKDRGMIGPLQNGDLRTAVNRGAGTWASLPEADGDGAYEGQNARAYESIERAYNDFLSEARHRAGMGDFN